MAVGYRQKEVIMFHFFVEKDQIDEESGILTITGSDVNHIRQVLRMKAGEEIRVSNREDKDYHCELVCVENDRVEAKILGVMENTELPVKIYLFQGLPKSDKMELIIQKAVELGVYEIIPVATRRAVVKLEGKKEASKVARWNAISESAAKQSKRLLVPRVTNVMSLKEAFQYASGFDKNLIPYENARGIEGTREEFSAIVPGMQVGIFVGPEGGFDEEEVRLAMDSHVKPVTLGKRILRTETAGMFVLSVLGFQLEEK